MILTVRQMNGALSLLKSKKFGDIYSADKREILMGVLEDSIVSLFKHGKQQFDFDDIIFVKLIIALANIQEKALKSDAYGQRIK